MNTNIKILRETVIDRIAAGEVIERPASVVKELVENSLDARSENIEIRFKNGGKDSIQVIDDGTGMSEEDALLSFERHATSKLEHFEDLEKIDTFGFRGEALSSIASVSITDLKTKTADAEEGTHITITGGKREQLKKIPWNQGTTISVNTLFFNVPGRRKFLKSNLSESRQIYTVFKKISLANTPVSFQLYNDDKPVWKLRSDSLENRLIEFYNDSIPTDTLYVEKKIFGMEIHGYIATPEHAQRSRGDQFLFINNRPVKNGMVHHAVISGYMGTIAKGDIPFYVLFIDIDPHDIDVNVHPSKSEVKFKEERSVYAFVLNAVKKALSKKANIVSMPGSSSAPDNKRIDFKPPRKEFFKHTKEDPTETKQAELKFESGIVEKKIERENIWQIHNKYILSQIKSGLVIIDQHAAHERILYEKCLKFMRSGVNTSQNLLFPVTLKLSQEDRLLLEELRDILNKIGFNVHLNDNTYIVDSVPTYIRRGKEETIIQDIIQEYRSDELSLLDQEHKLAASIACRGAIMAGDELSLNEMNQLIDELFATEFPFFCPHGRPSVINITLKELDKKFQR